MQRTILAAVHATKEQFIACRYMIQISAHLAFSYTKCELFASKSTCRHIVDALQNESDLHLFFGPQKYNNGILFVTQWFQWQRRHI